MADEMFPERPMWHDIDRVKNTPHMNWGDCSCSQCCIWRIVARLEAAEARLAAVLAVPYCRDAGHTEALHIAAKCCDPYETPCTDLRGEGDR